MICRVVSWHVAEARTGERVPTDGGGEEEGELGDQRGEQVAGTQVDGGESGGQALRAGGHLQDALAHVVQQLAAFPRHRHSAGRRRLSRIGRGKGSAHLLGVEGEALLDQLPRSLLSLRHPRARVFSRECRACAHTTVRACVRASG